MSTTGEYFKHYGFDPRAESVRLGVLPLEEQTPVFKQNLRAYKNEVIADKAVSIPYFYYFDNSGEVYTDSSLKPIFNLELQIDNRERGGLPLTGINRALHLARDNPNYLIALYSPEGPAVFDEDLNNPFSGINYDYGQLYLMFYDEFYVNSVAIKIKNEGKNWLEELLTVKFRESEKPDIEEIKTYIQTPIRLMKVDDFFIKTWQKNYLIYRSEKEDYYLDKIIKAIKDNFLNTANYLDGENDIESYQEKLSEKNIFRVYLSVIYRFLQENGVYGVALSGSCGGSMVTIDQVELFLGIKNTLTNNPFPQILSGFATGLRALFNIDVPSWIEGSCLICGKRTLVGGCGYCKNCEQRERRS